MANNTYSIQRIIGIGWNFPFKISSTGGILKAGHTDKSDSIEKVKQSFRQILSVLKSERIIRREFGSDLHTLLFEPNDSSFDSLVKSFINQSIEKYEHRAIITDIQIIRDNILKGLAEIVIDFVMIQTQQPGNLVYPFYKNLDVIT